MYINNKELSPIGFGTWTMGDPERDVLGDEANINAIRYALEQGITFINGAEVYGNGHTDTLIGRAAINYSGAILSSKLKKDTLLDISSIRPAAERIAQCLQRSSIDLLYVHWPYPGTDMRRYLPAMCTLVDDGLVGAIGVSNFNLDQLQEAMTIVGQRGQRIAAIENVFSVLNHGGGLHKTVRLPQPGFTAEMQQYCRENDVVMVAYTPLAKSDVRDNTVVQAIATEHQVTPAQVALSWIIQQGIVPIVKSSQPEHINENMGALNVRPDVSDMLQLGAIDTRSN